MVIIVLIYTLWYRYEIYVSARMPDTTLNFPGNHALDMGWVERLIGDIR
jgi:hypothetical protein